MASKLFSLFDDQMKKPGTVVAGTPQSLATISVKPEEQNYIIGKLRQFQVAESKVDYSDFSNFVFFNSALDYFNITAEKIINEYPYDASIDVIDTWVYDLDPYQRYLLSVWPKNSGHLRFDSSISSSYVSIVDVGQTIGDTTAGTTQQVGVLSPSTGSVAVEFWCNLSGTYSNSAAMVVFQKVGASGDGYTIYASGSNMVFRMVSGSVTTEVSAPQVDGQTAYYAFVYDRTNTLSPSLVAYTGSAGSFPVAVASASSLIGGPINIGNAQAYIGSGTLSDKVTAVISGALDEVRVWKAALQLADLTGTYNVQAYAQNNLMGLWHFNESGSINPDDGNNPLVLDFSGRRINGRIMNYWTGIRGSGTLVPFGSPSLMLSAYFNSPEVQTLIATQQASGTAYDRASDNIITRLVPENFLNLESIQNTTVLQNFLYILARNFDQIKVKIDQFTKVLRANYTDFNQTPDALLADIARFFGWEFTGNFLSADAFQYLLGKNVLANQDANKELDVKLYQIKNEFWKRTLINLMYLYKTKGTRESVESFFRIYGVNKNFVRLKEYGYKPNVGIQTNRIHADKSVYTLMFSGSLTGSVMSVPFTGSALAAEMRFALPLSSSAEILPTITTGSLFALYATALSSSGGILVPTGPQQLQYQVYWTTPYVGSTTGTLYLTGSEGLLSMSNIPIANEEWYNVSIHRNPLSGTLNFRLHRLNYDEIDVDLSASTVSAAEYSGSSLWQLVVGATNGLQAQGWVQEARVWNKNLTKTEIFDHTLNFQSYGTDYPNDLSSLALHWRLNDNVTASFDGSISGQNIFQDISQNGITGSGVGFVPNVAPFEKFLFDYNYIASPDFSWNEDKIRILNSSEVKPSDVTYDNQALALEFNMIDALNEDISQAISTMDNFNNAIGLPANRYRATYTDLENIRQQYFKRLQGRLNFRVFADMLEFFDRSFITMVQRLLPARSVFLGDEFVVESHMLERPKLQWNYRRQTVPFVPEGVITVYVRT
ncbi:MAG: hypothetical protein JO270_18315 [Acidobacteriaceae bacterium]|nr:hypothetical protein [Acidobacteriaceae bacterium]